MTFSVSGPEFVDEGTNARFVVTQERRICTRPWGARVSYTTSDGTADGRHGLHRSLRHAGDARHHLSQCSGHSRMSTGVRYSDWEILVPITADNVDESNETFTLTLFRPGVLLRWALPR